MHECQRRRSGNRTTVSCVTRKRVKHNRKTKSYSDEAKSPSSNPTEGNRDDVAPSTSRTMTRRAPTNPHRADLESETVPIPKGIIRQRPVRGGKPIPEFVNRSVVDRLPNSFDAENDNDAEHPVQLPPNLETARRTHTYLIAPDKDAEVVPVPQVELTRPDGTISQQQVGQGGSPAPDTAQPELTEQDRETFRNLLATATSSKRQNRLDLRECYWQQARSKEQTDCSPIIYVPLRSEQ